MKVKRQLFVDTIIVKPIAIMVNFLVRIVGKILRIDHSLDVDFERIAICKFKGMGSIIQATPLIRTMREKFPEAELVFVSTKANKALLEQIGIIDRLVLIDDSSIFRLMSTSVFALFNLLRKRPGVYIDLEIYSNFSTIITLFSLSKNRIGYYLRASSYRMGIYTHMMFFNPNVAISEVYLQIARLFGVIPTDRLYDLSMVSGELDQAKPYIVINPNASDLRIERRWEPNKFTELIVNLRNTYPNYTVFLIGSTSEREYTSSIVANIQDKGVINLSGKTNLKELITLINHASLMITNDTGPMHIAFACRTPAICLFGPCSPNQYGWHESTIILHKKVYCSPCVHEFSIPPCKGNNQCMKLIEVQEVEEAVKMLILKNKPPGSIKKLDDVIFSVNNDTLGLVNRSSNNDR